MDLLFITLFWSAFIAVGVGVFVNALIVNRRLSQARGKDLPITFTRKSQFQRLEDYKNEYGNGREDIWHKYLKTILVHGRKGAGMLFVIAILALIF